MDREDMAMMSSESLSQTIKAKETISSPKTKSICQFMRSPPARFALGASLGKMHPRFHVSLPASEDHSFYRQPAKADDLIGSEAGQDQSLIMDMTEM